MSRMPYMDEPWFALLRDACARDKKTVVAARLGVSKSVVGQVINGSGQYGAGKAGTGRLAQKVMHLLGQFACPHLSAQYDEPRMVTAEQCRGFAYRDPPTNNPAAMQHWQACQGCSHRAAAAVPTVRPPVPRKSKPSNEEEQPCLPFK